MGQQKAAWLFYTGERVPGEAALGMGLLDWLVPADELRAKAEQHAAAAAAFRLISAASFMISATRRSCARRARAKQKHARRSPTPATARTTTPSAIHPIMRP